MSAVVVYCLLADLLLLECLERVHSTPHLATEAFVSPHSIESGLVAGRAFELCRSEGIADNEHCRDYS